MECLGAAALLALQERGAQHSRHREWMEALAVRAGWDRVPSRIEIFDNSHWQGDSAVGVMVVATADGFERASYRRYRHDHLPRGGGAGGDDYAMMRSMLTRRMKKIASGEVPPPDLWLIDGGAAHVAIAHRVVVEAGWDDRLVCLGVAKGPDRHAGEERLHCPSGRVLEIDKGSALLHYLQVIRDEAHREAIRFHRRGRTSKALASSLDGIPGVGLARRKKLLSYFGSEKALAAASYETLAGMEGIGPVLARSIVDHLRTKQ
jgi:excinuclease ABC subunit C